MTVKEIAYKIEGLQIEAEKINSFQQTLFEAIFNGNNDAGTYEWAFVAFGDMTHSLKNELKNVTDAIFEIFRSEKEGA